MNDVTGQVSQNSLGTCPVATLNGHTGLSRFGNHDNGYHALPPSPLRCSSGVPRYAGPSPAIVTSDGYPGDSTRPALMNPAYTRP